MEKFVINIPPQLTDPGVTTTQVEESQQQQIKDVVSFVELCLPEIMRARAADADVANDELDGYQLDTSTLKVSTLSGGITNALFRVVVDVVPKKQAEGTAVAAAKNIQVVVRVFGLETDRLINREAEFFWQSQFLKTFGRCANGLCYEFFHAYDTVQPDQVGDLAADIGTSMASMHQKMTSVALSSSTPSSSSSSSYATEENHVTHSLKAWLEVFEDALRKRDESSPSSSSGVNLTDEQLTKIQTGMESFKIDETIDDDKAATAAADSGKRIRFECEWMRRVISTKLVPKLNQNGGDSGQDVLVPATVKQTEADDENKNSSSRNGNIQLPETVGHNDLLPGNIMKLKEGQGQGHLQFIDFEYSRRTFVHFDIANHFVEYGGLDCDWAKFPSLETQRKFFASYNAKMFPADSDEEAKESEFQRWSALVGWFVGAAHLIWSVWSLVQASYSAIDFDYAAYGIDRFQEYCRRKAATTALLESTFGFQPGELMNC